MTTNTWRDISTAPRDGTHLWLFGPEGQYEGYWEYSEWSPIRLSSHGCGCCGRGDDPPTHWQPLPAAPDTTQTGGMSSVSPKPQGVEGGE